MKRILPSPLSPLLLLLLLPHPPPIPYRVPLFCISRSGIASATTGIGALISSGIFLVFFAPVQAAMASSSSSSRSPPQLPRQDRGTNDAIVSQCACGNSRLYVDIAGSFGAKRHQTEKFGDDVLQPEPERGDNDGTGCEDSIAAVVDCHCPSCRKFHAAAFVSYLAVPSDWVRIETAVTSGTVAGGDLDIARSGDIGSSLSQTNPFKRYADTCDELGTVERWYCPYCASKLATSRPLSQQHDQQEARRLLFVNMGSIVDSSIPRQLAETWRSSRVQWQAASRASWALARPLAAHSDSDDEDGFLDEGEGGDDSTEEEDEDEMHAGDWESVGDDGDNEEDLGTSPEHVDSLELRGSCSCGASRYSIFQRGSSTTELQHCYCRLCRQLSGSPFMTWFPVHEGDIQWSRNSRTADGDRPDSSDGAPPPLVRTTAHGRRHICPKCASVLTIVYDDQPDCVWPAAGSLDDDCWPNSADAVGRALYRVVHICCRYRQPWYELPDDGLPRVQEAS